MPPHPRFPPTQGSALTFRRIGSTQLRFNAKQKAVSDNLDG